MRRSPCPECFRPPGILTNRVLPCKAPLSKVAERVQVGCDSQRASAELSVPRRRRLEAAAQTLVGLGGSIKTRQKVGVCLWFECEYRPIQEHVRRLVPS